MKFLPLSPRVSIGANTLMLLGYAFAVNHPRRTFWMVASAVIVFYELWKLRAVNRPAEPT